MDILRPLFLTLYILAAAVPVAAGQDGTEAGEPATTTPLVAGQDGTDPGESAAATPALADDAGAEAEAKAATEAKAEVAGDAERDGKVDGDGDASLADSVKSASEAPSFADLQASSSLLAESAPQLQRIGMFLVGGCFLLYLGLALYRRLAGGRMLGSAPRRQLRIADSVSLGGRRFVCAIEARGQTLLIGVSGDRIQLLTELGAEDGDNETSFESSLGRFRVVEDDGGERGDSSTAHEVRT